MDKVVLQTKFHEILYHVPDDKDSLSVQKMIGFLHTLLRMKEITPPTTEIMSVLKAKKPQLYHATRLMIIPTSPLYLLFQINMDEANAEERLEAFFAE